MSANRRPAPQTPRHGLRAPLKPDDVIEAQAEAARRGALTLWTIYDHPRDYPEGFVARMHEIMPGTASYPTAKTIEADSIATIRRIFLDAGLLRLDRHGRDDKTIVESWV